MTTGIGDSTALARTFHTKAFLLRAAFSLLSLFPLPMLHALGSTLGWTMWLIPNRRRRVAWINLTLCFPEMTKTAQRRLLRRTLVEFGKSLMELALLWAGNAETIRGSVEDVIGEDELRDALGQDKGVILAIPHLGAWEFVSLYCGIHYDFTALYRRPRVAELDAFMRSTRERLASRRHRRHLARPSSERRPQCRLRRLFRDYCQDHGAAVPASATHRCASSVRVCRTPAARPGLPPVV